MARSRFGVPRGWRRPRVVAATLNGPRRLLSQPAREVFGDQFVDHYAQTRIWEEREFHKAVTDWELARYFEII